MPPPPSAAAGTVKELPLGETSLSPTAVILNQDGVPPVPLPGTPYTANPHFVPGKEPVVDTVTAGVCVKVIVAAGLISRYKSAVPIEAVNAPGANVPVICPNVAQDIVMLSVDVASFEPNARVPEYVLSAGDMVKLPPAEVKDTVCDPPVNTAEDDGLDDEVGDEVGDDVGLFVGEDVGLFVGDDVGFVEGVVPLPPPHAAKPVTATNVSISKRRSFIKRTLLFVVTQVTCQPIR